MFGYLSVTEVATCSKSNWKVRVIVTILILYILSRDISIFVTFCKYKKDNDN